MKEKKVALIHDWLNGMRGGEKVLEEIIELFPGADVFTLFLEPDKISAKIRRQKIFTSGLNRYSLIRRRYQMFLQFFPRAVESFDLSQYDLLISSSHCVAKGAIPAPQARHFCYIHSPMRYIWDQYPHYTRNLGTLKGYYMRKLSVHLRIWDTVSSRRVDHFVANSRFVRDRVMRYYKREAGVIPPPVDTDFFTPGSSGESRQPYFLSVSALVPYKRVDQLVRVFNRLKVPLIIVGKGSEEKRLRRMAAANIRFVKNLTREELRELYRRASGYVFTGVEDFGISFVEAQACGLPVIAYRRGGICDIITPDTGLLFDRSDDSSVIQAIERFRDRKLHPDDIRENSVRFSRQTFREKFYRYVEERSDD